MPTVSYILRAFGSTLVQTLTSQDLSTRARIQALVSRDATARTRVAALVSQDTRSRTRLQSQPTPRDVKMREILAALLSRDATARTKVAAQRQRDAQARTIMAALLARDTRSRTNLGIGQRRDLAIRTLLGALLARNAATRVGIAAAPLRDVGSRLYLGIDPSTGITLFPLPVVAGPAMVGNVLPNVYNSGHLYGLSFADQPTTRTSPAVQGGIIPAGATFTLTFSNPTIQTQLLLVSGNVFILHFGLADGSFVSGEVNVVSVLLGSTFLCTFTVLQPILLGQPGGY